MAGNRKSTIRTTVAVVSCCCLLIVLFVPPGVADDAGQGTLEIRLKDHREAIGDFSRLLVTIDKILVSPRPGLKFWQQGWKSLPPSVKSVDLTQYTGDRSVRVFDGAVGNGSFDAIHVKLNHVEGFLKRDLQRTKVKNLVGPVKLNFEVRPQKNTVILLDLVVLDMSDHPPRAYELGIKGYELYTNGKLVDKIPPG